jgi:hypothetical protein
MRLTPWQQQADNNARGPTHETLPGWSTLVMSITATL